MRTPWVIKAIWAVSFVFVAAWFLSAVFRPGPSAEALRLFSPELLERARRRATSAYLASGAQTIVALAAVWFLQRRAREAPVLSQLFHRDPTQASALILGLGLGVVSSLVLSAAGLPFGIYGLYLDRSYGLSRMTLGAYLQEYLKSSLLSLIAYGLSGSFVAWAVVRFPRTWHLVAAAGFLAASVLVSMVFPILIDPMFNRFHPLPEGAILSDVRDLAEQAGMRVDKVLVMEASVKTSRTNAYFAGLGATKRIVLYDTLLDSQTREQVRLVVAHELGHWRYGHLLKGVLASAAGVFLALVAFKSQVPGVPVSSHRVLEQLLALLFVFAILSGYVLTPASNSVSRRFEAQADAYSLSLTKDPNSFVSAQVRLAQDNLSDVEPPSFIRWFAWTHPTTIERIDSARAFR